MYVAGTPYFTLLVACLLPFLESSVHGGLKNDFFDDNQDLDSELWMCADQTYKISRDQLCDSTPDCNDKSDESDKICGNTRCTQFQCSKTQKCLSHIQVCNFFPECGPGDNSDEQNCETNEVKCRDDQTACSDNPRRCYDDDEKCDGISFCRDGSDETDCLQKNEIPLTTVFTSAVKKKRKNKGKSIGKKARRTTKNKKRKTDATREFWQSRCASWKSCDRKSKKQIIKSGFKQCLEDPSVKICAWKPVKRFSLKKCKRVQRKRQFAKPCENLTVALKSASKI